MKKEKENKRMGKWNENYEIGKGNNDRIDVAKNISTNSGIIMTN